MIDSTSPITEKRIPGDNLTSQLRDLVSNRIQPIRVVLLCLVTLSVSLLSNTVEPRYVIGEEHPSVLSSDAVFDAREALELGALELTIGRMTSGQLVGYPIAG